MLLTLRPDSYDSSLTIPLIHQKQYFSQRAGKYFLSSLHFYFYRAILLENLIINFEVFTQFSGFNNCYTHAYPKVYLKISDRCSMEEIQEMTSNVVPRLGHQTSHCMQSDAEYICMNKCQSLVYLEMTLIWSMLSVFSLKLRLTNKIPIS